MNTEELNSGRQSGDNGWRERLGNDYGLPFEIAVRIRRLSLFAGRAMAGSIQAFGLSAGDAEVLAQLLDLGPPYTAKPSRLSEMCLVTTGAMTGRVDRLEKAGLVERIPSVTDRRALGIHLTAKGEAMAIELGKAMTDSPFNMIIASIGKRRLLALAAALEEIERAATDPMIASIFED